MEFFTMWFAAVFIIIIIVVVVNCFPNRGQQATDDTNNRTHGQRGLDNSFLKTIRVVQFDPERFKEGLECAICLSMVKEGEKTRVLPKCDHAFHMECIDMWFHSHSTCPVCRKPIIDQSEMPIDQQVIEISGASTSTTPHVEINNHV
ncbi:putative transcription factor C2H2 family [Helianthus annuus]|nr:putative transcription factor C2H2 family [Helianthus annuus]